MSNKTNDVLLENLFQDGENIGRYLYKLSGEDLQNFAEIYAKTIFKILEEQ